MKLLEKSSEADLPVSRRSASKGSVLHEFSIFLKICYSSFPMPFTHMKITIAVAMRNSAKITDGFQIAK